VSLFCKHDWEILSEKLYESELERKKRILGSNFSYFFGEARQRLVQIVACKKCGKIKRYAEMV